jgi:hypothetical protein
MVVRLSRKMSIFHNTQAGVSGIGAFSAPSCLKGPAPKARGIESLP